MTLQATWIGYLPSCDASPYPAYDYDLHLAFCLNFFLLSVPAPLFIRFASQIWSPLTCWMPDIEAMHWSEFLRHPLYNSLEFCMFISIKPLL